MVRFFPSSVCVLHPGGGERVQHRADVRRGRQLGRLRHHRPPRPAAPLRLPRLLLPHLQGPEGGRQGREHQGNREYL